MSEKGLSNINRDEKSAEYPDILDFQVKKSMNFRLLRA